MDINYLCLSPYISTTIIIWDDIVRKELERAAQ